MIKTVFLFLLIVITTSCSNIQLVLDDKPKTNFLKNNSSIFVSGKKYENFSQELFSYFGNNKKGEYIIRTTFFEKKENIAVKKNQVAEKIDYELSVVYNIYHKDISCNVFNKTVLTKFSFTPKSSGYNFGTDRSLERLYKTSIKTNIETFINSFPNNKKPSCI
tara:strand:+ start:2572 stop:3060 length:489 start_codon:yes stop_codon:yes gene_type:complete